MSAIKVNFEIGHVASVRTKKTPEGFTHDWEVFVRGTEGADISHFVEKVVFHLHETFPKPKRVVKEPPFSIKESGYAGFIFPIDIYVKNKDEPRKIKFTYDFTLQNSGFLRDRYVFQSPNEEFRKKLLKGGGIPVSNDTFYTNPDQENRSRDSFTEEKQQLISKPKLSSDNAKKHKSKDHKNEMPHRTSSFENLFGPPIQKPSKISPEPKKNDKTSSNTVKPERKEKDRPSSEKKSKHETKDVKPEKPKLKEEKDKVRPENNKGHSKEQERSKEKSNKRPSDRVPSPEPPKKRANLSPGRKPASPPARSSSASSIKEDYKSSKYNVDTNEHKKKFEEKPVKADEVILNKEVKEKKKKDKKSHDRDKERKEKKDYKKESHKPKETPKEVVKEIPKPREIPKEKEPIKEPIREKPPKPEKPINKFSIENLRKSPVENEERTENHKSKERGDSERKHKHKKKDKKRDDSKEKHKESNKEKKHKHDKNRDIPPEKPEIAERRDTTVFKERQLPEPASPISLDTASQCSSKSGIAKMSHIGAEDINSSHSDSESSMIVDDDDSKVKLENPSPVSHKRPPSPEPEPEPEPEVEPEPEPEPESEPVVVAPPPQPKEKSKKHKDKKDKREEKRRKRKANDEEDTENRNKGETGPSTHEIERGESSGSMSVETKVQDNGVSSSLGEDAEPGDLSPDYMVQLRGLQQRIMMIKNNEDLERVVNLIAETGRYEVTTQTFDFDLCLLDRSTVQQLIQLVGC